MRPSATRVTGWYGGEGTASQRGKRLSDAPPGHVPHVPVVKHDRLEVVSEADKRSHRQHRHRGVGLGIKKVSGHHCWLTVLCKLY